MICGQGVSDAEADAQQRGKSLKGTMKHKLPSRT